MAQTGQGAAMAVDYRDRLQRVLGAIHAEPARDWSLDDLADVAALSRFHFHRVFAAMTGETPAETLRRIRLNAAAHLLVREGAPVASVAHSVGYGDAVAFSRAFRAAYGLTPGAFRRRGQAMVLEAKTLQGGLPMFPVLITDHPARQALGLIHTGPYDQINRTFGALDPEVSAQGLWRASQGLVAVYFDDPARVAPAALRSLAGVLVPQGTAFAPPLQRLDLTGGRHAVLTLRGPYTGLQAAYAWLFGPWLAASGERLREAPSWELYRNTPLNTAPDDLLTDIHLPLESADA